MIELKNREHGKQIGKVLALLTASDINLPTAAEIIQTHLDALTENAVRHGMEIAAKDAEFVGAQYWGKKEECAGEIQRYILKHVANYKLPPENPPQ